MSAKRVEYQIVGRYMDGKEVIAYHLQSIETGKSGKFTKDQVVFLIGRDQITNATGQLYQDKVLIRGKGMSLEALPIVQVSGEMKHTEVLGKIRKGTSAEDALEQWTIIGTIRDGKNVVGYAVQNAGCAVRKISRAQTIKLIEHGRIGNARVQNYNDPKRGPVKLIRGVGVDLTELPSSKYEGQ